MDLDGVAIFVKVIQAGSFSQAAKLLGMPNSTVSAKVSALEKRLGVTLLQRTTRRLRLTQAGDAYFQRAVRALEELQAAENELEDSRGEPNGRLRLTAPVEVGHGIVPALVHRYLELHPRMEVELIVTNRVLDLLGEGIDLAIRAGELKDSGLISRRFELGQFCLWASPEYLSTHAAPRHPKELAQHRCLRFSQFKNTEIRVSNGRETVSVPVEGRLMADDFETLRALAILGEGIVFLPSLLCAEETKQRKLIRVLPQWRGDKVFLSLVYPAQRFVPVKIRAFIAVAEQLWKKRTL
ncbi:MAG TPA: LysR family transcriptional regulator [Candidatus Binatia bacterium]|nr:LysR family transcriptional regulator [Candidatus Binatia bacterium]